MKSGKDRSTPTKGSKSMPSFGDTGLEKTKTKPTNPGYGKSGPRAVEAREGKSGS